MSRRKTDGEKVANATKGLDLVGKHYLANRIDRLVRRRMAEVERQARHIEELREKIDAERSCACSFDAPGDVCAAHSPALTRARAEVERLHKAHQAACEGGDLLRAENARLRAQVAEYFAEPATHPVEREE